MIACHNCGKEILYDHDSGYWIHAGFGDVDGRNGLYCSPEMWNDPRKRVYAKPVNKVYVVMHNFCSHDMFVPQWAKDGNPTLHGIYDTREEAEKHIRPGMDDYIVEKEVEG